MDQMVKNVKKRRDHGSNLVQKKSDRGSKVPSQIKPIVDQAVKKSGTSLIMGHTKPKMLKRKKTPIVDKLVKGGIANMSVSSAVGNNCNCQRNVMYIIFEPFRGTVDNGLGREMADLATGSNDNGSNDNAVTTPTIATSKC